MRGQFYAPSMIEAPQVRRRLRTPQHNFHIRHAPYEIQPFFIAPVLPGETMKNLSFQARVLSKPLKSSIIGWWCEHYFFYVKHRDMADSTYLQNLMLDDTATLASASMYRSAATDAFYGWTAAGTGYDYVKACLVPVIESFFRDEGQAWSAVTIDSNPAAYVNQENWSQNALLQSAFDAVDVTIPIDAAPAPDVAYASDVVRAIQTYEKLRLTGALQEMTYEDYLRSYGVRTQDAVVNRPELVRYSRSWTYPSSHVIPSSVTAGASDVTSAVSWSIAERADKDRFFKEPGFLFGVAVVRPKVYFSAQKRPAVSMLDDLKSWLPANAMNDAITSWKEITDSVNDVIGGTGSANWAVDIKDLFIHGDQFSNFLLSSATDVNAMALPSSSLGTKAPVQASVDAMFVSGDCTQGIWQDGIVRLAVATHLAETSPRGSIMSGAL